MNGDNQHNWEQCSEFSIRCTKCGVRHYAPHPLIELHRFDTGCNEILCNRAAAKLRNGKAVKLLDEAYTYLDKYHPEKD